RVCLCDHSVCLVFASRLSGRPLTLTSHGAGLLNTYKSLFSLDDSLAKIKTRGHLLEYLGAVFNQALLIQPLSSAYFVEETGQLKILSGINQVHAL
ncbi:MAG: hypothetical protein ACK56I_26780, partial [bacterium]